MHNSLDVGDGVIWIVLYSFLSLGYFPGGSDGKASVYNAGDPGLIPS